MRTTSNHITKRREPRKGHEEHEDGLQLRTASSASPRKRPRRSTCSARSDRVVGISGYTVRPPEARAESPRSRAFLTRKIDKIVALRPICVLGVLDLQADIAAALVRRGAGHGVQPAQRRRDPADVRQLGGARRLRGRSPTARWIASHPVLMAISSRRPRFAAASACVLRGMGRPADLGHPVGRRARRDRRRRPDLPRAAQRRPRARIASSIREKSSASAHPTSCSASWCGKSAATKIVASPAGACAPSCTAVSSRSSRPTSCSRDRRL